ncbi:MAG TPA: 3'(2'),5'-bisphosphate nucleotidase [Anaerolineae bacterium]|nr:3'(2'),5'-bisphosphate nucleotidase [Anaerolineae bacterium]
MFDVYRKETEIAVRAVSEAVQLVRAIQAEVQSPSMQKEDYSPVTVADFAAQALIAFHLKENLPHDVLVAEEDSSVLQNAQGEEILRNIVDAVRRLLPLADRDTVSAWIDRGSGELCSRFWVLDPVDGTKGFLRGGQCVVALALIEDGRVVLGVLGCPNLDQDLRPALGGDGSIVLAVRGQGSWVAPLQGEFLQRLQVSTERSPTRARLLRSFESAHTDEEKMAKLIDALAIQPTPIPMDSQAKIAVLAAGHAELIFRLNPPGQPDRRENIWDQAPGSLVVQEAGGRVTDWMGHELDFTAGRQLNRNLGVVVSNGHLHGAALQAIQNLGVDPSTEHA